MCQSQWTGAIPVAYNFKDVLFPWYNSPCMKMSHTVKLLVCLFCVLNIALSDAFTLTRIRDININIPVGSLVAGGRVQSIDEGTTTLNVSGNTADAQLSPGLAPFNSSVTTTSPNRNIFRANFTNNEAPCNTSIDIVTEIEDTAGNSGRLSNPGNLSHWISVDYEIREHNRRCRNNGSLRRVNYRGTLTINDLNNAGASTNYRGTVSLTITVL